MRSWLVEISFTRTLWYAIRETKEIAWVERSGATPATEKWKQWLEEAKTAAKKVDREWKAVDDKNKIFDNEDLGSRFVDVVDAEQRAPLQEVEPVAHLTRSEEFNECEMQYVNLTTLIGTYAVDTRMLHGLLR